MKLTCGPLLLAAVCVLELCTNVKSEKVSWFARNFQSLHREPPVSPAKSRANIEEYWIEQKLDNFDENNQETWKMRYLANGEFFQKGGPVFIFVGGEWTISNGHIQGGHMYDMAKEHNGFLFYTEHRYYGKSWPTKDLTTENLKYLNVKQALADLANFIRTMKAARPGMENSKFILTGGSYSGTMVTWFKKLYPELVVGCWASSAPLLAKANFKEYRETVGQSIRKVGGEDCYDRIQNGITEMESMIANKRGAEVKAMLKLCNDFDETSDLDLWTLFTEIGEHFAVIVQSHGANGIEKTCKNIMKGNDDLIGLAKYLLTAADKGCMDVTYKNALENMMDSESHGFERQWFYQTCNEYGWYQTSSSQNQPFGTKTPLQYFTHICSDVFGQNFTNGHLNKQIMETNDYFGGLEPKVENVYFTHGELDPWRSMGIADENQATIIPMYSHCNDLASISPDDTAEQRASKERIAALVRQWLGAKK